MTYNCLFYIKVHNTENTKCCKVCRGGIFFLVLREWLPDLGHLLDGLRFAQILYFTTHSFKISMSLTSGRNYNRSVWFHPDLTEDDFTIFKK